jgi:hypothetical protein
VCVYIYIYVCVCVWGPFLFWLKRIRKVPSRFAASKTVQSWDVASPKNQLTQQKDIFVEMEQQRVIFHLNDGRMDCLVCIIVYLPLSKDIFSVGSMKEKIHIVFNEFAKLREFLCLFWTTSVCCCLLYNIRSSRCVLNGGMFHNTTRVNIFKCKGGRIRVSTKIFHTKKENILCWRSNKTAWLSMNFRVYHAEFQMRENQWI